MKSRAAGKQAVAVGHMANILLGAACRHDGTGAAVLPQIHIVLGVEGHNPLTGGAGGGVDADALRHGLAHQAVGICLPQVVLFQEGQLVQVVNTLNILGSHALFFHFFAVVGHIVPNVLYLLYQAFILQSTKLLIGHGLNFRLIIVCHGFHLSLSVRLRHFCPGRMRFCSAPGTWRERSALWHPSIPAP